MISLPGESEAECRAGTVSPDPPAPAAGATMNPVFFGGLVFHRLQIELRDLSENGAAHELE